MPNITAIRLSGEVRWVSAKRQMSGNPADQVEIRRPDDQRDRHLSEEKLQHLKRCLDLKMYRKNSRYRSGHSKEIYRTFFRLRLIVLVALTTGMRMAEILSLQRSDLLHSEEVIAVRTRLKSD